MGGNATEGGRYGTAEGMRHVEPEVPPARCDNPDVAVPDAIPGALPENAGRRGPEREEPWGCSVRILLRPRTPRAAGGIRLKSTIFLAAAFALAFVGTTTAESCFEVSGHFVATAEIPCLASPVLLCTHGELDGDLPSRYDFVMTSQQALSDPLDPLLLTFTGESIITLADGRMFAQDTGMMRVNPAGPWPFQTTVNVFDGEGAWAGATGTIVATGGLDLQRGVTEGDYVGRLCVP